MPIPAMGGENIRRAEVLSPLHGEPKTDLDGARTPEHTGGIDARPREYERRVIGFLDETLLSERSTPLPPPCAACSWWPTTSAAVLS